jgi:hypothetical protein
MLVSMTLQEKLKGGFLAFAIVQPGYVVQLGENGVCSHL